MARTFSKADAKPSQLKRGKVFSKKVVEAPAETISEPKQPFKKAKKE
jgi:hypothetical protein